MRKKDTAQAKGPCQAIWRRLAYVTAELLYRQETSEKVEDPAINLIAVNIRPMAKRYLGTQLREVVNAGSAGISLDDLCDRTPTPILTPSCPYDRHLDRLMVEAVRQQFPSIFARPLRLGLDGNKYDVAYGPNRHLTATPVEID